MKQTDRVLNYMREFGAITALEAMRDLGIMRLGARCYDLKQQGIAIETSMKTVKNRWGENTHVAEYRLAEPQTELAL